MATRSDAEQLVNLLWMINDTEDGDTRDIHLDELAGLLGRIASPPVPAP